MSDVMFYGVLRMPYKMVMEGELSRRQFYSRAQEAADRVEKLEAEVERLRARLEYIEEHATTSGGGNGFTITCFVPADHEDIGCGIDAAIAAAPVPHNTKEKTK